MKNCGVEEPAGISASMEFWPMVQTLPDGSTVTYWSARKPLVLGVMTSVETPVRTEVFHSPPHPESTQYMSLPTSTAPQG